MKTQIKNLFLLHAVIAGLNLLSACQVTGQIFTILRGSSGSNGSVPGVSLTLSGDTLYGTIEFGGSSRFGAVFAVNTFGMGLTNVYSFTAGLTNSLGMFTNNDGIDIAAGVISSGGTLYGTAAYGGRAGFGTVFSVGIDGTGFRTLHTFAGYPNEGSTSRAALILVGDTLYGTTIDGGSSGNGTVFAVNSNGTGFTNLHSFAAGSVIGNGYYTNSDGANPWAGLVVSGNTLFGTTTGGGSSGSGTVFAIHTNGTGFTTLHSFTACSGSGDTYWVNSDGANPWAGLVASGSSLYGTAAHGGNSGVGTVFKLNTDGTGFTTLHSFTATSGSNGFHGAATNTDGASPYAGLVLVGHTLYGRTTAGGSSGAGTVFGVNTNGVRFAAVHNFAWNDDLPSNGLTLSGNTLYGTTLDYFMDKYYGAVFSLSLPLSLPTILCSTPLILECTYGVAVGTVHAEVEDTNGDPLQVVWTIDGAPFQTNDIPSGGNITASNVSFTTNFGLGEHVVGTSVSNGQTDPVTCSTTVSVHDTTPPRIRSIEATPKVLWPPNHRMVPVSLKVEAVDNCDSSPMAKITNITCNEPGNPIAPDWEITGAQTLNVRAERLGKGPGRIYTVVVECKDRSGNVSIASVNVTVPHN